MTTILYFTEPEAGCLLQVWQFVNACRYIRIESCGFICRAIRGGTYQKRQRECMGAACMSCQPAVCVALPRSVAVDWTRSCCSLPPTSHVCMRVHLANDSPSIDGKAASVLLKIFLEASQAAKAARGHQNTTRWTNAHWNYMP